MATRKKIDTNTVATVEAPTTERRWAVGPAPDEALPLTGRHILDVAERLFARHGIEKVSSRELVAASGQRNASAVTYHFGTREALLGALLSRRLWSLNKARLIRLHALEKAGKSTDVHAVIGESFRVLADAVQNEPWGPDFVLILAQVFFHPELDFRDMVSAELSAGSEQAKVMARTAMGHIPSAIFAHRAEMAYTHGTYALAMWVSANGPVTRDNEDGFATFVDNTVDFLTGGVMAPVSRVRRTPAGDRRRQGRTPPMPKSTSTAD